VRKPAQHLATKPPSKNLIAATLRKRRSKLRLSQADLARGCQIAGWDIGRDTIAKLEGGTRCIIDSELIVLSKVLKMSVHQLLGISSD